MDQAPDRLSVAQIRNTAQEIVRKCEYGIIVESNYGMVVNTVQRNSELFEMDGHELRMLQGCEKEILRLKARILRKYMPSFVREAMDEVISANILSQREK